MVLDPVHPLARFGGGGHRAASPTGAGALVDEVAWRGDLILRAALLLSDRIRKGGEGNAAHAGDAVRQPELVEVLALRRLLRRALMHVQIDDAGHDVEILAADLALAARG